MDLNIAPASQAHRHARHHAHRTHRPERPRCGSQLRRRRLSSQTLRPRRQSNTITFVDVRLISLYVFFPMAPPHRKHPPLPLPTGAELDILAVLWRLGPATVREVHEDLGKDNGYTTTLKQMKLVGRKTG